MTEERKVRPQFSGLRINRRDFLEILGLGAAATALPYVPYELVGHDLTQEFAFVFEQVNLGQLPGFQDITRVETDPSSTEYQTITKAPEYQALADDYRNLANYLIRADPTEPAWTYSVQVKVYQTQSDEVYVFGQAMHTGTNDRTDFFLAQHKDAETPLIYAVTAPNDLAARFDIGVAWDDPSKQLLPIALDKTTQKSQALTVKTAGIMSTQPIEPTLSPISTIREPVVRSDSYKKAFPADKTKLYRYVVTSTGSLEAAKEGPAGSGSGLEPFDPDNPDHAYQPGMEVKAKLLDKTKNQWQILIGGRELIANAPFTKFEVKSELDDRAIAGNVTMAAGVALSAKETTYTIDNHVYAGIELIYAIPMGTDKVLLVRSGSPLLGGYINHEHMLFPELVKHLPRAGSVVEVAYGNPVVVQGSGAGVCAEGTAGLACVVHKLYDRHTGAMLRARFKANRFSVSPTDIVEVGLLGGINFPE